ncbi:DUF3098 domain-containing protein [Apibacter raozihei]|uniref:DUF3098 domain-containing protein n=1 Tax=Apibacter TaxID=1778601 RepID=UPI000FE2FA7A|nr:MULTISPECIES: DUF3098 domain-containing protein [Apibacter]
MKKNILKNTDSESKKTLLFGKKNYTYMLVGIIFIALGLILMTGPDANTRPDGVYDKNYWNNDIFSFRRIRLAPILIVVGFIIEIYAIMINSVKKDN